jgi:hypothetical protein
MGALQLRGPGWVGRRRRGGRRARPRRGVHMKCGPTRAAGYPPILCARQMHPHLDTAAGSRGMQLCIANNSNSDAC